MAVLTDAEAAKIDWLLPQQRRVPFALIDRLRCVTFQIVKHFGLDAALHTLAHVTAEAGLMVWRKSCVIRMESVTGPPGATERMSLSRTAFAVPVARITLAEPRFAIISFKYFCASLAAVPAKSAWLA
jgi:hypothetical protein